MLKTGISSRFFAQLNVRHSKSTEGDAIVVEVERLEGSNCDVDVVETVVAAVAVEVGVAVEVDAVMTTGTLSQSSSLP